MWIFQIAAAAGAWWRGLSSHCAYAAWVLRYAAPWRVVCHDRRVAADASRPPACLSVLLHLTGGDIAVSAHTNSYTCTYTRLHVHYSSRAAAQASQAGTVRVRAGGWGWTFGHFWYLFWQNVSKLWYKSVFIEHVCPGLVERRRRVCRRTFISKLHGCVVVLNGVCEAWRCCGAVWRNPWYLACSQRPPRWKVEPGVDLLLREGLALKSDAGQMHREDILKFLFPSITCTAPLQHQAPLQHGNN